MCERIYLVPGGCRLCSIILQLINWINPFLPQKPSKPSI
jgi:hypothetical protein